MNPLLDPAIARAIGLGLLHSLWQDALVALALALALHAIDRRAASLRHGLACFALVLMVALPGVTGALSYRAPAPATPVSAAQPAVTAALSPIAMGTPAPELSREARFELPDWSLRWMALGWLLGVTLSAARIVLDGVALKRVASLAEPAPEEWQIRLDRLARRIGVRRMVTLLTSDRVGAPCTFGWLKPVVLVPGSALTGLSPRDLELVLAHELAHIARSDFMVNVVQRVCESLLFFHPAAHWVSAQLRAERENCCDDVAVRSAQSPVAYARALTELEALRVGLGAAASVTLSALGGSLTERVKRLVMPERRHPSKRIAGASAVTVLGTLAVIAPLAIGSLAHAGAEPTPAPDPEPVVVVQDSDVDVDTVVRPFATPVPDPLVIPNVKVKVRPMIAQNLADLPWKVRKGMRFVAATPGPDGDEHLSRADELVMLHDAGVTPEFVQQMRGAGLDPSTRDLAMLANAGVTGDDVKKLDAAFGRKLEPRELARLKNSGVTPEVVQSLRRLGFSELSVHEALAAQSMGLDGQYVKSLQAAGVKPESFHELIALRSLDVQPEYVAQLTKLGIKPLTAHDLAGLKSLGVTAEYVEALKKAGLTDLTADQLRRLKASGVEPKFADEMNRAKK
jgi:beta-lactamase regulating signal transducer with metallopeptidase domain